jgi:hypothetical protein
VLERVSKRHANATFIFVRKKPNDPLTKAQRDSARDYLTAVMDHVKKGISAKSRWRILKVKPSRLPIM